jgi:hypothetical protein
VLPDLDVGVTSGRSVQQLLGGAHGGDLGLALLQGTQACWCQTMPLVAILHSTLAILECTQAFVAECSRMLQQRCSSGKVSMLAKRARPSGARRGEQACVTGNIRCLSGAHR